MICPYAKKEEYICSECHNSIFYYTKCCKSITEPMTNEEWFDNLPTEEKANRMTKFIMDIISWNNDPKPSEVFEIANKWLKEVHKE